MITCEDFPYICRICMRSGQLQPLSKINTLKLIKTLLQIDINTENLPKNICYECTLQLDNIHKFVENCQNCTTILETLAGDTNNIDITDCGNKEFDIIENDIQTEFHISESLDNEIEEQTKQLTNNSDTEEVIYYEINCSECGQGCPSKRSLAAHMMSHRKDKIYQCSKCPQKFPYAEYLRRHTLNAHGVKPFVCEVCQEGFVRKRSFDEHMHSHTGESPYVCSECGQSFKVGRHFNKHMYLFHNPNLQGTPKSKRKYVEKRVHLKLECKECGKIFASRSGHANHQLIHRGVKPFLCNVCGKLFLTNAQLQLHIKRHTGGKSLICSPEDEKILKQTFHTVINAKKNSGMPGEILICSYCNKSFHKKTNFQKHIQGHQNLLQCNICSKTFPFISHFNNHMRIHSGEKPYMCTECGKVFSQKQTLTVHMRIHLGITPFECSQCDKKYHDSTNLKRHFKRHHQKGIL